MATFQCNISQHCWPTICKPWLNDHNISTLHFATLLGTTCCVRLATTLQYVVACCRLKKIELVCTPWRNILAWTWPNDYNIMQHPQMLREKFDHCQIRANNIQHVTTRRNMVVKKVQHVEPNNVVICCVEMLRSFGQGFSTFPRYTPHKTVYRLTRKQLHLCHVPPEGTKGGINLYIKL